jgi:hypothetical protein
MEVYLKKIKYNYYHHKTPTEERGAKIPSYELKI